MEEEQPPDDLPSSPPASQTSNGATGRVLDASTISGKEQDVQPASLVQREETVVHSRPGVKEGKRRMIMELEDDFGDDSLMADLATETGPAAAATASTVGNRDSFTHDYTKRFADLSAVNLNLRPGEIEAAPIQATTLDGRQISFQRKKKVESWQDSQAQQVCAHLLRILHCGYLEADNERDLSRKKRCLPWQSWQDQCSKHRITGWFKTSSRPLS